MGGGEAEQSETQRARNQKEKEIYFLNLINANSSYLGRVRKDAVLIYERRRDMLTVQKTHAQSL
jgi:type IV secretory pathway VirB9-like protein